MTSSFSQLSRGIALAVSVVLLSAATAGAQTVQRAPLERKTGITIPTGEGQRPVEIAQRPLGGEEAFPAVVALVAVALAASQVLGDSSRLGEGLRPGPAVRSNLANSGVYDR